MFINYKFQIRNLLPASFLQFTGIVGSGIFVLPYLFDRSNFIFATFFLIILTGITAVLNQFYVDIVTSTSGDHQLAGYCQRYLGKKYKSLATLNLIILSLGAISAYFQLFVRFTTFFIPVIPSSLAGLLYYVLLFAFIQYHQKLGKNIATFLPAFILVIPLILFLSTIISPIDLGGINLIATPSFSFFGATLFALSGFTIIPEVRETLGRNRDLSHAVLVGLIAASVCYFLYAYSIIRLSGPTLSIDSVSGLAKSLPLVAKTIALFGMVVTLKASSNFLLVLKELFYRDLHFSLPVSKLISIVFPLFAILMSSISLLTVISLTGHFTIFVSSLLICLIRLRLKHNFWTKFLVISIMVSLTLGLFINAI